MFQQIAIIVATLVLPMSANLSFAKCFPISNEFLMINETLDNGESKMSEYAIPEFEADSLQVKDAMKQHMLSKSILRHLDGENVNTSGRNVIDNLLMCPEAQLTTTAAVALGNTDLHGTENPVAMAFYATALRFSTVLKENDGDTSGAFQQNKRWWWWTTYCSNSDSWCYSNCPIGSAYSGLCSPGCECWWWICDDCCYNTGYLHDVYACSDGTDTLLCWVTPPIGLAYALRYASIFLSTQWICETYLI